MKSPLPYQVYHPIPASESLSLPLVSFSVGRHERGNIRERYPFKRRGYYFLGWVGEGRLEAQIDSEVEPVAAGEGLILPPEALTGFHDSESPLHYCMKFRGPAADSILDGFGLPVGSPIFAGSPPGALFDRLRDALQDVTPSGAFQAGIAAYEILSALAKRPDAESVDPLMREARSLLEEHFADETLNVSALARRLGIHRTLLARRFKAVAGVSPSAYLRRCRVREALTLLQGTDLRIGEVARRVGVPDASQFARLIRGVTGLSPREVRRGE